MLTEKGNIVIGKQAALEAENYELLRKTGLQYIQQFSGKLWTDHNIHDPGITILEILLYAATELAYRISFPVPDLLTAQGKRGPDSADFFTARKILTSHPITVHDYRKLILDRIPGVRNVWLETLDDTDYDPTIYFDKKLIKTSLTLPIASHPYEILKLKGLYVVKLEAEDYETIRGQHPHYLKTLAKFRDKDSTITDELATEDEYKVCLANYTRHLLLDSRNLCEDFEVVTASAEEWVAVCADIELQPDANADDVFKEINNLLYNYINPFIQFYSFKELIEKGKRTEDIFNGPAVTRGFIDEDELNRHGHKEVLYVSDIINLLMDIPGVLQVKSMHLSSYKKNDDGTYTILEDAKTYCLHLKDKINAVFQFMRDAGEQDKSKIFNHIRFSKGLIYFSPKRYADYSSYNFIEYPSLPADFENDLPVPGGNNRQLNRYYSVQNDFPLSYYTGMDGIPDGETTLRKAQRLQTKGFLLFFDQLLADYLSHLNNLKSVFTWRGGATAPVAVPFELEQGMIKDLRKLLKSEEEDLPSTTDDIFFHDTYKDYAKILETPARQKQRRSRMLDHLLARFNEVFTDYAVFKFQQNQEGDFFEALNDEETINDKIQFLKVYPVISGKRSHAFNYTKGLYAYSNISGLQLRIQKMLGLTGSKNKPLVTPLNSISYKDLLQKMAAKQAPVPGEKLEVADTRFAPFDSTFGVHILEHILLRPLYQDNPTFTNLLPLCGDGSNNQHADCLLPDNYSMQMTVVAPGWLAVSNHMDFRAFAENLIRQEAPAHVTVKICWLDPALMFLFEKTTEELFTQMKKIKVAGAKPSAADINAYNAALADVYTMMGLMKNMYLASHLDECENINYNADTNTIKVPLILNYSALGSGEDESWFTFKKPAEPGPGPVPVPEPDPDPDSPPVG